MAKISIGVMILGGAKFYRTLIYTYNPLFKINLDDVAEYVNKKLPTLKYEKDVVLMLDKKNIYEQRRKRGGYRYGI